MSALKKILITPYFGKFPEWMDKFLPPDGYSWLLDTNLESFKQRVKDKLGIDYPGSWGESKIWDYRCALGLLYEEEIKWFGYWGTMDFDIVFGDVNKFFPDEELKELDVWSNHDTYVAGFWSLYRNCKEVNELFLKHPQWKEILENPTAIGWVEDKYSRLLEESGLRYKYSGDLQGDPYRPPFKLKKENDKLSQLITIGNGTLGVSGRTKFYYEPAEWFEIPMLHFRRSKIWPL